MKPCGHCTYSVRSVVSVLDTKDQILVTYRKIRFVTGDEQKKDIVGNLIDEDNAMPFMLVGGGLEKNFDIESAFDSV